MPLSAAGACVAAALLCWGCGGEEPGGRGAPGGLKEISPEEYEELVHVDEPPPRGSDDNGVAGITIEGGGAGVTFTIGDYLSGPGDADSFDVIAVRDEVDVVFEWPRGQVDFWVRVYGENGDELGDFDLDNGDIIQLLNGGKFTLEIYSKEGSGSWSATYEN